MSQPQQIYFSGDAQVTALNAAISSNTTDTALVAHYPAVIAGLTSTLASAQATAAATPNQTNFDAVVTAVQNRNEGIAPNALAGSLADQAVNGPTGTIMTRTVPLVQAALTDAIAKLNTEIASIGYASSVTLANAALRDSLAAAVASAQFFLNVSGSWKKPADVQPAIDWLVN